MFHNSRSPGWSVIGATVRGAAHVRTNRPNQDAILWWTPEHGNGSVAILTVADGHGSAKCFRSEMGARLAVTTATDVMRLFVGGPGADPMLSNVKRTIEERLPRELARRWVDAVEGELYRNPLTPEELQALSQSDGEHARRAVEQNHTLAFGATLLVALATDSYAAYLQLGDGDILTTYESGDVERPLPRDERLFANETTSLASATAWEDFRVDFQVFSAAAPALILLSTDGYANSFRDDAGFLKVGTDVLSLLRRHGEDVVEKGISTWLARASEEGSGDDITLGVLCRSTGGVEEKAGVAQPSVGFDPATPDSTQEPEMTSDAAAAQALQLSPQPGSPVPDPMPPRWWRRVWRNPGRDVRSSDRQGTSR